MAALSNKKHEAFAKSIARGESQSDAYRAHVQSDPSADDKNVWAHASRLAAADKVRARILELRQKIEAQDEAEFIAGVLERKQYLTRAIRTPLSCLEDDSDLIVRRKTRIECSADKECQDAWEVTETHKVDPLDAIKELNKMTGGYVAEKVEHSVTGVAAEGLRLFLARRKRKTA